VALEKATPLGLIAGRDAVCPFVILALERVHTKAQLFAERAAEEAAKGTARLWLS